MKVGVYIGRFQPWHRGHQSLLEFMQKNFQHIIVLVGSANKPISVKNPFDYNTRKGWIQDRFEAIKHPKQKISVLPLNDYLYNEKKWEQNLVSQINKVTQKGDEISIVGHSKDDSSYYLKSFPQFGYVEVESSVDIDATTIRNDWFAHNCVKLTEYEDMVSPKTRDYLSSNQAYFETLCVEKKQADVDLEQVAALEEKIDGLKITKSVSSLIYYQKFQNDIKILAVKDESFAGKPFFRLPTRVLKEGETFLKAAGNIFRDIEGDKNAKFMPRLKSSKLVDTPKRNYGVREINHAFLANSKPTFDIPRYEGYKFEWLRLSELKNATMLDDHNDIIDLFFNHL